MLYIKTFLFISGIISVLVGLYYNENSSGGAKFDSNYLLPFINEFSINFSNGLILFLSDSGTLVHSPIFYIIAGNLLSFFGNLDYLKVFYILFSSSLPLLFYQILKYQTKDNFYVFLFSLILFFSPYFRSSSIWLLGDNLSLILFSISIIFYFKQQNSNDMLSCYLSILFLALCCYVRYYYLPFFFFYIFIYSQKHNYKDIIFLLIFSFLLSLPAILYLIYVIKFYNYLMFLDLQGGHSLQNYSTNFFVIMTIILFYLMPFIFVFYEKLIVYILKEKRRIFLILLIFLFIYFLDLFFYEKIIFFRESNYGGGVFKKLLDLISVNNELLIILFAYISLIIYDFISKDNRVHNYLLLSCLIMSFPFVYLFQKYLDPFIYFVIFGLIKSNQVSIILDKLKNYLYLYYGYFIIFFIVALIRY